LTARSEGLTDAKLTITTIPVQPRTVA